MKTVIDEKLDYLNTKQYYEGDLTVAGDILSGVNFTVKGNLEVEGLVENVRIKCYGDVRIKGGFLGQNIGMISCKGDFFAGYVQNAYIKANNVIIDNTVSYSNILALSKIKVNGAGKIIGGNYYAKNCIIAKEIGSPKIIETTINIGYDFLKKREFEILKKKIIAIKMQLDENMKVFKNIFKNVEYPYFEIDNIMKNISKINDEKTKYLKLLENIQLKEEFERLKNFIKKFSKEKIASLNAYLKVNKLFPGVKITILDKTLQINETIDKENLVLNRENIDKWQQY